MRDLEEIREDLLTAKAMQNLSRHNGFLELVVIWEKDYAKLENQIRGMPEWDPLSLGRWQGRMQILNTLIKLSEKTKERIPKLEEELKYADKSARIPVAVRPDVTPPKWET